MLLLIMHAHNFVDLTGRKFGRLEVLSYAGKNKHKQTMWNCKCICGTISDKRGGSLVRGTTTSCGCHMIDHGGKNLIDLKGQRFGRLLVEDRLQQYRKYAVWQCLCDCGNKVNVKSYPLTRGRTRSCGCLRSDVSREIHTVHGLSGNIKFELWRSAKRRANTYKIPFNLEISDIPDIPEKCPVLGLHLMQGIGASTDASPTLDRIIPADGYVKGNIDIISRRANVIKNCGTMDEHMKVIEYIRFHLNRGD